MPSQQVIETLKQLQSKLGELAPAIAHIEKASEVAKKTSKIAGEFPILISDLKAIEEAHRNSLQNEFKKKILQLEKEVKSIIDAVGIANESLSNSIKESSKIDKSISKYVVEIQKINFPDRLDKIDNQISAISIGLGNLQSTSQRIIEKFENSFLEMKQHQTEGYTRINENILTISQKSTSDIGHKIESNYKIMSDLNGVILSTLKTNRVILSMSFVLNIILAFYIMFK